MIRPDTQKYRLLEIIGISGEFPSNQLSRVFSTPAYTEKIITELKADKLIRVHYKDKLRGYRLTKYAKELLLTQNPIRFQYFLTGKTETNFIKSEPMKRFRLHQKAQVYLTLSHANIPYYPDSKPQIYNKNQMGLLMDERNLPYYYSSREIKDLGEATTKIKNSRIMGILLSSQCIYCIYNTGTNLMKWEYRTEVRLNAFLQQYFQSFPYPNRPQIRAIMFGDDMEVALQLLTSTGGHKRSLFSLDASFEHFHFLPSSIEGESLLKLLSNPEMMKRLNQLLLSDLNNKNETLPIDHDAVSADGSPVILAYDFDMHRINRFNTGLNVYEKSGNLICFDFQIPVLKKYLSANIHFSSIDLNKFRKEFLHEP